MGKYMKETGKHTQKDTDRQKVFAHIQCRQTALETRSTALLTTAKGQRTLDPNTLPAKPNTLKVNGNTYTQMQKYHPLLQQATVCTSIHVRM